MRKTACKSSGKGKKKRKHLRSMKKGYSYKAKEKQRVDSYLAGAYCVFSTIKYTYIVASNDEYSKHNVFLSLVCVIKTLCNFRNCLSHLWPSL